jgi:hypothetical protein
VFGLAGEPALALVRMRGCALSPNAAQAARRASPPQSRPPTDQDCPDKDRAKTRSDLAFLLLLSSFHITPLARYMHRRAVWASVAMQRFALRVFPHLSGKVIRVWRRNFIVLCRNELRFRPLRL